MPYPDQTLTAARVILRIANYLNWFFIGLFALGVILSFPLGGALIAQLAKKYHDQPLAPIVVAMRVLAILGILAGVAAHVIFARVLAIVATVRDGDPFVSANARRLQAVGWALLAIQLLDLGLGALSGWMAVHHVDQLGWRPSLSGWFAVLLVFVLARVFTIGARMRDDLALTV